MSIQNEQKKIAAVTFDMEIGKKTKIRIIES